MPQVFALLIAGAGIYAGYKWVSRVIAGAQATARGKDAELREAMAKGGPAPKDLGKLERDPSTGVYRPLGK